MLAFALQISVDRNQCFIKLQHFKFVVKMFLQSQCGYVPILLSFRLFFLFFLLLFHRHFTDVLVFEVRKKMFIHRRTNTIYMYYVR